jgi:hypothetical protein
MPDGVIEPYVDATDPKLTNENCGRRDQRIRAAHRAHATMERSA